MCVCVCVCVCVCLCIIFVYRRALDRRAALAASVSFVLKLFIHCINNVRRSHRKGIIYTIFCMQQNHFSLMYKLKIDVLE
jgi:hypothetical protein